VGLGEELVELGPREKGRGGEEREERKGGRKKGSRYVSVPLQ
jgi:hypothetical protein